MKKILLIILCYLSVSVCFAQQQDLVSGVVVDDNGNKIEGASVVIVGLSGGVTTDKFGRFNIKVPSDTIYNINFSFIGFEPVTHAVDLRDGNKKILNIVLKQSALELEDFVVTDTQIRSTSMTRIDPKIATVIPSISSDQISAIVKALPGVSSSNDLSSQYNVRGGNYDENLVFVNDIEIYKPFLLKQGQQEGLSFVNSDLVSSLLFSAGGFESKYGDKMSSVLDVKYKKPKQFGASLELSLTSVNAHLELADKKDKVGFLFGVRQKSNQYVLKSLQTKGEYKPSFTDVQTYLNWNINKKLELSFLGYYSHNRYWAVPQSRETSFGTINEAYKLKIYFEGQERDYFNSFTTGVTLNYKVSDRLNLKLIGSYFMSDEHIGLDVMGEYWIGQMDTSQGGDEDKIVAVKGIGGYRDHARNDLNAQIISVEHKGNYIFGSNFFQWGIKYQRELIYEKISEWNYRDSSDYILPKPPDYPGALNPLHPELYLENVVKATNNYSTNRFSAFVQDNIDFSSKNAEMTLTAGLRFNYWDFNKQFNVSPRVNFSIKPDWKQDVVFKLSAGYYVQPPFYHEIRDWQGLVHNDVLAQESAQFVFSTDYNFRIWDRPFKFTGDIYYKHLMKLNPYEVNNVKVQYYAKNTGKGFATGLDLKLNGELIKGVESWVGVSIMRTAEKINGWEYFYYNATGEKIFTPGQPPMGLPYDSTFVSTGYIPRPTDQRFNFNLFFQDYLPWLPTLKMHINFVFGTGLPFGAPGTPKSTHIARTKAYNRLDIGMSYQIIGEGTVFKNKKNPFAYFESLWVTVEVFNVLGYKNVLNYMWITDVEGRKYAIPNYQTPRQFNVRLVMKF